MRAARRALATRTCQFMGIYLRAYLCTREYAWLLVRVCLLGEKLNTLIYARERAYSRVSRYGDIFERGTGAHGRICGYVNCLANNEFPSFFVGISLFSPWQKRKKKRIFYEWSDEIGYRGERSGVRNSRSIDKYRQMRGSYRLGGQVEENTRF